MSIGMNLARSSSLISSKVAVSISFTTDSSFRYSARVMISEISMPCFSNCCYSFVKTLGFRSGARFTTSAMFSAIISAFPSATFFRIEDSPFDGSP